jgi:hypothetical protein
MRKDGLAVPSNSLRVTPLRFAKPIIYGGVTEVHLRLKAEAIALIQVSVVLETLLGRFAKSIEGTHRLAMLLTVLSNEIVWCIIYL